MRNLTESENLLISGGLVCLDNEMWHTLKTKANADATMGLIIGSGATAALTYGLTNGMGIAGSPFIALAAGFIVAPYAWAFGYFGSSTWNVFSTNNLFKN